MKKCPISWRLENGVHSECWLQVKFKIGLAAAYHRNWQLQILRRLIALITLLSSSLPAKVSTLYIKSDVSDSDAYSSFLFLVYKLYKLSRTVVSIRPVGEATVHCATKPGKNCPLPRAWAWWEIIHIWGWGSLASSCSSTMKRKSTFKALSPHMYTFITGPQNNSSTRHQHFPVSWVEWKPL